MQKDEPNLSFATVFQGQPSANPELLCLLRLHEIALGSPAPVTGLRAMVDEIVRVPGVLRAVVAVPNGKDGQVRFLAHVGKRGFGAHAPIEQAASPMLAKALHSGELVQLLRSEGDSPHACVNVPIRGTTELLGVFGVGASLPVPLEPWREEFVRSIADLMALLLLRLAGNADLSPQSGQPLARLTRRQGLPGLR